MISRNWSRTPFALALALAILSTYSMVALAAPAQGQTGPSGELSVNGEVSVNGTNAISGATVFSDSTITTAQNSSAVVSLGKLGRVELMPNSSVKVSFTDTGVTSSLDAGRVRLSTSAGVSASVITKDGSAVADNSQPAVFTVDVACGNTVLKTEAGRVELRAGNTARQVAAGQDATAGQAAPGTRCTRLQQGANFGFLRGSALAALLAVAGAAVAAAVIAGTTSNNNLNFGGGGVTVVSPTM